METPHYFVTENFYKKQVFKIETRVEYDERRSPHIFIIFPSKRNELFLTKCSYKT